MVGGRDFALSQFNRATQAQRQVGSSFKIYDYTAAIDSGMPASTIIADTPVSYPMGDGTQWSPLDDDHSYMGSISLREALVMSRNVVAVKLAERIGKTPPEPTYSIACRCNEGKSHDAVRHDEFRR